jgi:hypothetical protein
LGCLKRRPTLCSFYRSFIFLVIVKKLNKLASEYNVKISMENPRERTSPKNLFNVLPIRKKNK